MGHSGFLIGPTKFQGLRAKCHCENRQHDETVEHAYMRRKNPAEAFRLGAITTARGFYASRRFRPVVRLTLAHLRTPRECRQLLVSDPDWATNDATWVRHSTTGRVCGSIRGTHPGVTSSHIDVDRPIVLGYWRESGIHLSEQSGARRRCHVPEGRLAAHKCLASLQLMASLRSWRLVVAARLPIEGVRQTMSQCTPQNKAVENA